MKELKIMKYENKHDNTGSQANLGEALNAIKSPSNEGLFKELRELYLNDKNAYDELKLTLSSYGFSGTFTQRNNKSVDDYIGLAILDIDKVTSLEKVKYLKLKIKEIEYTAFCFVSPSGHGLKVGVFMDCPSINHSDGYNQVKSYYERKLMTTLLDRKTKDISRMNFVSYDPDIYINENHKVFEVNVSKCQTAKSATLHIDQNKHFEYVLNHVDSLEEYKEGNRNNYLSLTAHIANRHGINKQIVNDYFINLNDLSEDEIINTVKSAYSNSHEFGVLKYDFAYAGEESLPIPENVYSSLPSEVSKPLEHLKGRERDMALLAILTFSSSVFHNIKGKYRHEDFNPNLLTMIIAPPASGKGIVSIGEKLVESSANHFNSLEDIKLRRFQLSGNSSSAMLYSRLAANEGRGMMFEKEGDAISANFRNEWGDISVHLRQTYHNEDLNYERKTDKEMIVVKNPRFALLVTMTPNQLSGLVSNRENGLFSRVLFYIDNSPTEFESLNPADVRKDDIEGEIYKSGYLLSEWYQNGFGQPKAFELTNNQWDMMNEMWKARMNYWLKVYGEHNKDIVLRLMASSFKVMMILSAWRYVGRGDNSKVILCTDQDLETAINLMDVLFYHAIRATKLYQKGTRDNDIHSRVLEFLGKKVFTTPEYIEKFVELGGTRRTAQRRLANEQNESIKKLYHGKYQKVAA